MATTELSVTVKANISVSRETAETCLNLVSIYANDNGLVLVGEERDDGIIVWSFEKRSDEWEI